MVARGWRGRLPTGPRREAANEQRSRGAVGSHKSNSEGGDEGHWCERRQETSYSPEGKTLEASPLDVLHLCSPTWKVVRYNGLNEEICGHSPRQQQSAHRRGAGRSGPPLCLQALRRLKRQHCIVVAGGAPARRSSSDSKPSRRARMGRHSGRRQGKGEGTLGCLDARGAGSSAEGISLTMPGLRSRSTGWRRPLQHCVRTPLHHAKLSEVPRKSPCATAARSAWYRRRSPSALTTGHGMKPAF